jgi:hypothetical protein
MAMLGGECSSCCGGWYCYNNCADFSCTLASTATVSISSSNFLLNAVFKYQPDDPFSGLSPFWRKVTSHFNGSHINGTHTLTRRNDISTSTNTIWESNASFWPDCQVGGVNQISNRKIRLTLTPPSVWTLQVPVVAHAWLPSQVSSSPSPTGFRQSQDFSCASPCGDCYTRGRQNSMTANCNQETGAVTLFWEGFVPYSSYPVEFPVSFPTYLIPSGYSESTEYVSGPLTTSWFVNSVSIG